MSNDTLNIKRDELYEQVWSRPMWDIAKDYGLSDVGLAKICRRLKVPVPGRGYWAQRDAGKAPPKPALPPLGKGDLAEVEVSKQKPSGFVTQALFEIEQLVVRENLPENKVTVTSTLVKPHALVAHTAQLLRAAKPSGTNGLIYPPIGKGCLDIRVTPGNLGRALRIMDALIKALETRGYNVSIDAKNKDATVVTVLGQNLEIRLEEAVKRTDHVLTTDEKKQQKESYFAYIPRYDFHPTGELALRIKEWSDGKRRNWSDSNRQHLEDSLNDFLAGLMQVAAVKNARDLEWKERERQWAEERRRQAEEEQRRQEEAQRLKMLEEEAVAWQRSQRIRSYVGAVKETASRQDNGIPAGNDLERWLTWALEQADRLNPLPKRMAGGLSPENTPHSP